MDSLLCRKRSKWNVHPETILETIKDFASSNPRNLQHAFKRALRACLVLCLGFAMPFPALWSAQDSGPQSGQPAAMQASPGSLATVHGEVLNQATGQPLPRALVRIDGDAGTGALTDGDGRFEIPGVPPGPQDFEVIKPGFLDAELKAVFTGVWQSSQGYAHNVIVAAGMPDVNFAMTPLNAIHGQIQLSSGDLAVGIQVTLLKRVVQDGRASWQIATATTANSEGAYRFGELADGQYALLTQPAMESDAATNLVVAGSAGQITRGGYASQFYPDALDLADASKIDLADGQQAEADLVLALEPFHAVTAMVTSPEIRQIADSAQSGVFFNAQVLDGQGHPLPYTAQYDADTHTVQCLLPDGTYSLLVTATSRLSATGQGQANSNGISSSPLIGEVDFSIAGSSPSNLRIPLAAPRGNPVQVSILRNAGQPMQTGNGKVIVFLSPTGSWNSAGMMTTYAVGDPAAPLPTAYVPPGAYWARTSVASLCEDSFTAGGANLAREPLVVGLSGSTAPLSLTLRDDCASLTLALPGLLTLPAAGIEKFYTVYVVPDFDSTHDVVPQTLRASTGGSVTIEGLTPGNYHVYTFDKPVLLEYHNRAALTNLSQPGQPVTLSPGSAESLVLEVPER